MTRFALTFALLVLPLAGCPKNPAAARIGIGLGLSVVGRAGGIALDAGAADQSFEACVAMTIASDTLPMIGRAVASDGVLFSAVDGSVGPCVTKFGAPQVEGVDARIGAHLDGLFEDVILLAELEARCPVRVKVRAALAYVKGGIPSVVDGLIDQSYSYHLPRWVVDIGSECPALTAGPIAEEAP